MCSIRASERSTQHVVRLVIATFVRMYAYGGELRLLGLLENTVVEVYGQV